jgi:hypothetical protein
MAAQLSWSACFSAVAWCSAINGSSRPGLSRLLHSVDTMQAAVQRWEELREKQRSALLVLVEAAQSLPGSTEAAAAWQGAKASLVLLLGLRSVGEAAADAGGASDPPPSQVLQLLRQEAVKAMAAAGGTAGTDPSRPAKWEGR